LNALEIIFGALLFIHVALLVVTIYNFFTAPKLVDKKYIPDREPKVSVLIPVRNEESNIGNCLDSIFQSSYRNYEVKVLDDFSTDSTIDKIKISQKRYENLELVQGEQLPDGWSGKNWACHQLAARSNGEYLLFLDADIFINNAAIKSAVAEFQSKKVKMLSIFPTQKIKSWGEWLIVPLMDWLLLTFLPLNSVYKASHASLAAANGQFILFDKESYLSFGGHEKIKSKVVEDMEFARGFKQDGCKVITFLGNNLVNCRMYRNFNEALNGFSKNFYPGFNISGTAFFLLILLLFTLFILPFFLIYFDILFTAIAGLIFTERIFISSLSKQNLLKNIILFLPQIFMLIIIGIKSLIDNKRKKVTWKGRNIK